MPPKTLTLLVLVWCVGLSAVALGQETTVPGRAEPAFRIVEESLKGSAKGIDVALWIGDASGRSLFERGARTVMPTASSIKTFYLVELFARHESRLDQPVSDANEILTDDHPAVSHFPEAVRVEIRRELGGATVRRVGEVMMGKTSVSNAVYNAAANLVTAHLGGPEKLTKLIHSRDSRFEPVVVRRYMLRDRTQPGDNEATAESFAALYQALSSRKLNGVSEPVMTALHEVLKRDTSESGPLFEKDGGLSTDPLTSVKAGWKQTSGGPLVFVVMCRQSAMNQPQRTEAYEYLRKLSARLRDMSLKAANTISDSAMAIEHTSDSLEAVRAQLRDQKAVLLDVRDQDEWDDGHLADARLVPLRQLRKAEFVDELLRTVPSDKIVYLHCAVGRRALEAGRLLKARGYDVRPLSAGYDELLKNGFDKAP